MIILSDVSSKSLGFSGMKETDLAALRKSLTKNLEFLGLFGTYLEFHGDLPGKSVSI